MKRVREGGRERKGQEGGHGDGAVGRGRKSEQVGQLMSKKVGTEEMIVE